MDGQRIACCRNNAVIDEFETDDVVAPGIGDVLAARERISPFLASTPLYEYGALSDLVGTAVYVKHETHLPTGAFKVRGGVNLVAQLSAGERERGLLAASTGNHAQSLAYASRLFGIAATIYMPVGANRVKVAATRALGAEVVEYGRDFDEARDQCELVAVHAKRRYVHSGNEPALIAGVATAALEIIEHHDLIDVIIVPIGGGSGAAGACIVAKAIRPNVEVIGVQSTAAPAAYRSWREARIVHDRMATFAEGLATRVGFELPQQTLRAHLADFILVTDDEIRAAMLMMIEATRHLVEAAGAAPLAAALRLRDRLAGRRVALVCSGGNVTLAQLKDLLESVATSDRGALPPETGGGLVDS